MKRCPMCGERKPLADFGKNRQPCTGLMVYCRDCWNGRMREERKKPGYRAWLRNYLAAYRRDHAAHLAQVNRNWRAVNPEKVRANAKTQNAKRKAYKLAWQRRNRSRLKTLSLTVDALTQEQQKGLTTDA